MISGEEVCSLVATVVVIGLGLAFVAGMIVAFLANWDGEDPGNNP